MESDPEIEFNPRHEGGGEQHTNEVYKIMRSREVQEESDDDIDLIHQETRCVPKRYNRVIDDDERQSRQRQPQHRRDEVEKRLTVKPDTYDGSWDWESYISHFEICAELGGWSPRVMALTLASRLQGQARIFYMNLSSQEKNSYAGLVRKSWSTIWVYTTEVILGISFGDSSTNARGDYFCRRR